MDTRGAIAIFQVNALHFPESPNVYDSIAEAYLAAKDTAMAIIQYEKVLQLDPKGANAAKALANLKGVHPERAITRARGVPCTSSRQRPFTAAEHQGEPEMVCSDPQFWGSALDWPLSRK